MHRDFIKALYKYPSSEDIHIVGPFKRERFRHSILPPGKGQWQMLENSIKLQFDWIISNGFIPEELEVSIEEEDKYSHSVVVSFYSRYVSVDSIWHDHMFNRAQNEGT